MKETISSSSEADTVKSSQTLQIPRASEQGERSTADPDQWRKVEDQSEALGGRAGQAQELGAVGMQTEASPVPTAPVGDPIFPRFPRPWSALTFLALVVLCLGIFAGEFVNALIQVTSPTAQVVSPSDSPLRGRGGSPLKPFDLPAHRTMLYVQGNTIYSVTTYGRQKVDQLVNGTVLATPDAVTQPLQIETPGFRYNPSLPPLVTPASQLIYAGTDGLWMTDLVHNRPRQIVTLSDNQEVTSLVLSRDGSQLAWSTAPKDGQGEIQIFAGPVGSTKLVYHQAAGDCPCFRVFSFWSASDVVEHDTLLLTDDHGDDGPVEHGLWIFSMNKGPLVKPALVIKNDPPQGPLALSPDNTALLYTTYEGNVPVPDDMPDELATLQYANSLVVASLHNTAPYLRNTHIVLPEQNEQRNSAQYHWVMSPSFSPDGQTLVYVEFSADSQGSFTRTNALYMVQIHGSTSLPRPMLVATTAGHYVELGSWWDAHTVTVFIDKGFYALDIQRGVLATITQTGGYAHEIAILN